MDTWICRENRLGRGKEKSKVLKEQNKTKKPMWDMFRSSKEAERGAGGRMM